MLQKIHLKIRHYVSILQKFSARIWYGPLIALLAGLDNFLLLIPTDGILISSSMLNPKRWFVFSLIVAIGSTLGALCLSYFVGAQGLPWILETFPAINETKTWELTQEFFNKYGLLVVFVVAVSPLIQQPAVILATLAKTSYFELAVAIFVGRFIKFLIMSYIASHAPKLLTKLWGVRGELEDVGLDVKVYKK